MSVQTRAHFRSENSREMKGRTEHSTSDIIQAQAFAKTFRKENEDGVNEITMRSARVRAHRLVPATMLCPLKFQRLPQ